LAARGIGGLGLSHPLADILLGEQAQVSPDLVVEFSIRSAISEQSSKSCRESAQIMDHLYSLASSLQPAVFGDRIILGVIRNEETVMDQPSSRAAPECSWQSARHRPAAGR